VSADALPSALRQFLAMAEIGLDLSRAYPKPLTTDKVQAAGVVVTMGCVDACPLIAQRLAKCLASGTESLGALALTFRS
jgi:protein-tyrosine-phosphatase